MPSICRIGFLSAVFGFGCFSPSDDAPVTGDTGASSDGDDDETGPVDPSMTGSETNDPSVGTSDDAGTGGTTSGADTTGDTGTSECDDRTDPCAEGQYCVAGRYCDNPPVGMVAVPAGSFMMGCNDIVDTNCQANEFPYHEVILSAFAIDRTEVTVAAYTECVDAGGCSLPHTMNVVGQECTQAGDDLPVTCVDWFQARDYCEWIGGQLPTEAQWEKAARGTDGRLYPWGNDAATCDHVNMAGCETPGGVVPVGSKPAGASPYGALDMAGNVLEWVADWYDPSYYADSPDMDPEGPAEGTERWPRNGAYFYDAGASRCSFRGLNYDTPTPEDANLDVGFRCAFVPGR